jgi:hypothetical protein
MEGVKKRRMGNAFSSRDTEVKSWFNAVVGIDEPSFHDLSDEERSRRFFRTDEEGNLRLMRGGPGKPHKLDVCCGRFEVKSVGELTEARSPRKREQGTLTFVTRKDAAPGSLQYVDVAHLQAQPENRGAMFQVASNMNGVEGISEGTSVEEKTFVSDYIYDKTQGPAASISAGGAAVARVYAAFGGGEVWERQTKDRQINFVESLGDFCTVHNGYVVLKPLEEAQYRALTEGDKAERLINSIRVGVHSHCQVTFGRRTPQYFEGVPHSEEQLVHQTFGAAVNVGQGVSGIENRKKPFAKDFAHLVLLGMYRGCFLAARRLHCRRLFLTLLGGGVFANDTRSLMRAVTETFLEHGAGMDVTVVLFSPTPLTPELREFVAERMGEHPWVYQCATKGVLETLWPEGQK